MGHYESVRLPESWVGRLDAGLSQVLPYSRQQIQKWIQEEKVLVNGSPSKGAKQVTFLDHVVVHAVLETSVQTCVDPLDLLYEDAVILVLNKPCGVIVHGGGAGERRLTDSLLVYCPQIVDVGDAGRPGIVHRLDKDTEGVMVVAKTQVALEALKVQFQERRVQKRYLAMVKGSTPWETYSISAPIGKHKSGGKMIVQEAGKPSETRFEVRQRFTTKTLLDVCPVTGRTHQIRVHLQFLGYPVLGDPLYHHRSRQYSEGQLLQAYRLGFQHPMTGQAMVFVLPPSARIQKASAS